MTGREIVALLTEVVAKGGNLLLNVGPAADGTIPELQAAPLRDAGTWITAHDDVISDSRPWTVWGDQHTRYTMTGERLNVIDLSGAGTFEALGRGAGRVRSIEAYDGAADRVGTARRPSPDSPSRPCTGRRPGRLSRRARRTTGCADRVVLVAGRRADRVGAAARRRRVGFDRATRRRHLPRAGTGAGRSHPPRARPRPHGRRRPREHRRRAGERRPARTRHRARRWTADRLVPAADRCRRRAAHTRARLPRRRPHRRPRRRLPGPRLLRSRRRGERSRAPRRVTQPLRRHAMGRRRRDHRWRRTHRRELRVPPSSVRDPDQRHGRHDRAREHCRRPLVGCPSGADRGGQCGRQCVRAHDAGRRCRRGSARAGDRQRGA